MSEDKMRIWNLLNRVEEQYLEPMANSEGKVLVAINPQHRWQILTEQFGPCGKGWGWTVTERWTEKLSGSGAVTAFVKLSLWYMDGDVRCEVGEQIGGTLVEKCDPGDAYKSAITDAVGKSAAFIGLGADVYLGKYDGKIQVTQQAQPASPPIPEPPKAPRGKKTAEKAATTEKIEPLPGQKEFPPEVMAPTEPPKPTLPPPPKTIAPAAPVPTATMSEEIPF